MHSDHSTVVEMFHILPQCNDPNYQCLETTWSDYIAELQ